MSKHRTGNAITHQCQAPAMKINNLAAQSGRKNTPIKHLTSTSEQLDAGLHRAA